MYNCCRLVCFSPWLNRGWCNAHNDFSLFKCLTRNWFFEADILLAASTLRLFISAPPFNSSVFYSSAFAKMNAIPKRAVGLRHCIFTSHGFFFQRVFPKLWTFFFLILISKWDYCQGFVYGTLLFTQLVLTAKKKKHSKIIVEKMHFPLVDIHCGVYTFILFY